MGLKLGERVAIASKNSPDYVEAALRHLACGSCRGAGQRQAARRGAWLHSRTVRRAGLSCVARYRKRHCTSCAEVARTADRDRRGGIRAADRRRSDRDRAARARRSRLAVLYLRHDRPAEGRHAHPQGAGRREQCLPERGRHRRARRSDPARRADEPRLGPLHDGLRDAARRQRGGGVRRLRAGGNLRPVPRLAAHLDVRGADHGEAAGGMPGRLPERKYPHHRVGRRADVCRGRAEGAGPVRAAAGADLRPG